MTEPTSHKTAMDWALCTILWSRHCSVASPNTYPTSPRASHSKICHFAATIHLLPPVSVTDIARFCRCRVPMDYFVATWPLVADETCNKQRIQQPWDSKTYQSLLPRRYGFLDFLRIEHWRVGCLETISWSLLTLQLCRILFGCIECIIMSLGCYQIHFITV